MSELLINFKTLCGRFHFFRDTMLLLCILIFFVNSYAVDPDSNVITVPLKMGENEFSLSFPATTENAFQMAHKFCVEKAGFLFEHGKENLEQCRKGLSSYLTDAVTKKTSSKRNTASNSKEIETIKVSLGIGGRTFDFDFIPELESTNAAAEKFCVDHLDSISLSASRLVDCVQPVEAHLKTVLKDSLSRNKRKRT